MRTLPIYSFAVLLAEPAMLTDVLAFVRFTHQTLFVGPSAVNEKITA